MKLTDKDFKKVLKEAKSDPNFGYFLDYFDEEILRELFYELNGQPVPEKKDKN